MSKVSYEEAKKAFREICSGYEEPNSREIVGNFIAKHQPPTLDEVVNTALKNNFDCWYEEDLNRIVFGAVLPEFFVYKDKVVSAMPQTNHYFKDYEMFDMGRRYLESQKEKKMKKQLMLKIVNNEYLIEQQHLENKRGMQRVYDLERETRDLKDELKKMEEKDNE